MTHFNLHTSDFDRLKSGYSKIDIIRTYENGSKDYKVVCTCPDCGGRGYLSWTSVDQGRCWTCSTTGKIQAVVHVGDSCKKQLTQEEVNENIRKREKANEEHFLSLGYKPVDFKFETWTGIWFNEDSYYRIIKETEKAFLLGRVDNLKQSVTEITFWVPKKSNSL